MLDKSITTSPGGMLSFCGGELLHSGDPIVEGIRYILAAFCYVDLIGSNFSSDRSVSAENRHTCTLKDLFANDGDKSAQAVKSNFTFGFNA